MGGLESIYCYPTCILFCDERACIAVLVPTLLGWIDLIVTEISDHTLGDSHTAYISFYRKLRRGKESKINFIDVLSVSNDMKRFGKAKVGIAE